MYIFIIFILERNRNCEKMANKLSITSEEILKMTDEEWNKYRQNSWLRKREYYNQDMPEYYLPNRERYAQYLKVLEKRIENREKRKANNNA